MWNVGWCWVWWCWICVSAGILVTWNHRRNLDQWSTSLLSPRSLKASPTLNLSRRANPPACSWMWAQVWWWPLRTWQQGRVSRFPSKSGFNTCFFLYRLADSDFHLRQLAWWNFCGRQSKETLRSECQECSANQHHFGIVGYGWLWLVMVGYGNRISPRW